MASWAEAVENPVFLVGAERSGSTLLRLMLSHHPRIAFDGEFEFAVDLISPDGRWPDLRAYHGWLSMHRIFRLTGYRIDPALAYPELVKSFLVQKMERENKPIVGATVHRHFDKLLGIWPQARFIHLLRDGRDVARSCIRMGWAGNVWAGVEEWIDAERLWERTRQMLPADRYIDARFEQLVTEPVPTLSRLCDFIGVPYDPAMLTYPQHTTYSLPDPSLAAQWKRKLTSEEIRLVEARIAEMLAERNYAPSGLPRLEVTRSMKRRLARQNTLGKLRFRIRRYGRGLVLAEYLTRRLGPARWNRRLTLKIQEIANRHLK